MEINESGEFISFSFYKTKTPRKVIMPKTGIGVISSVVSPFNAKKVTMKLI